MKYLSSAWQVLPCRGDSGCCVKMQLPSAVKRFSSHTATLVAERSKIVLLSQLGSEGCGLDETGAETLKSK